MDTAIIGVVAVIYRKAPTGDFEFLLLKHKNTFWTFVGGKVEDTDKSIMNGLQREVQEELGLSADSYTVFDTGIVNSFTYGNEKVDRAGKKGLTHYFAGELHPSAIPQCKAEIQELGWFSKIEILEQLEFEDIKMKFLEVYDTLK